MGDAFYWTEDRKRKRRAIVIGSIVLLVLIIALHNIVNSEKPTTPENEPENTAQEQTDEWGESNDAAQNAMTYVDPVPIYTGGYKGPFDIYDENAGISTITDADKAAKLVDKYLPETIGVELVSMDRNDTTALTCYHFLQSYGPLLIENAAIDVYVDDWGNWKKIEGRYAVLTGSISTVDERIEAGAEYRILLCEEQKARTVILGDAGKYFARDGQTEVPGI